MLKDSVLAESPWGAVRLVDEELEEGVDVLRQELGEVEEWRGEVGGVVKASGGGASGGGERRREEFLGRWGGEGRV